VPGEALVEIRAGGDIDAHEDDRVGELGDPGRRRTALPGTESGATLDSGSTRRLSRADAVPAVSAPPWNAAPLRGGG
jgi:hypothetical protein